MRIEGEGLSATYLAAQGQALSPADEKAAGREAKETGQAPSKVAEGQDSQELSPEARREVEKLKQRDAQVKAHEQAHMAAGAGLVRGGAQFSYQKGPDGQMYAVGGEVTLDTSAVPNNPAATMTKAQQIRSAALAPADPSPQDQKVAAQASNMESKAASELAKKSQTSGQQTGLAQKSSSIQIHQSAGMALGGLLDVSA